MKILTLTSLFPNHMQPNLGVFIKKRVLGMAHHADVKVVAPVPWVPPFALGEKAQKLRSVSSSETMSRLEVLHPRYFVTPKKGRRFYGNFYYWSLRAYLCSIYEEFDFDMLDVHWAYPDGYAGVKLAKLLKIPVSVTLRGSDIHSYPQNPIIRDRIKVALQGTDLIIAVSRDMREKVAALDVPEEKVRIISNGIDADMFSPVPQGEARRSLGVSLDAKTVLAVGRLEAPKRFDLLIRAVAHINLSDSDNLNLVIVGSGTLRPSLELLCSKKNIRNNVIFVGEVDNRELSLWYSAVDLFCLASDNEGCPNVLLESLSCGTAPIASDVGGVKDIITDGENGFIVAANEVSCWCEAIRKGLAVGWDREFLQEIQKNNSWENVGEKVIRSFEQILRSR